MARLKVITFAGWIPFFLLLPVAGWAAEEFRFGLCVKTNPSYSIVVFAAEEKDFWKKNGLTTSTIPFDSSQAYNTGWVAGAIDLGMCGTISEIQAAGRGVPVVIVADTKTPQDWYIWVRGDSPIREPKDLKGARIGATRAGGVAHAYGVALAKALGLEKDIKFVFSGGATQEIAAVRAGITHGTTFSFFGMARLRDQGIVREVARVHDYLPKPWIDLSLAAHKEFKSKAPEVVRRGVASMLQAGQYVMSDAPWAKAKLKAAFGFEDKVAELVYSRLSYGKDGWIEPRAVENMRRFALEYGLVAEGKLPPADQLFTNEFNR